MKSPIIVVGIGEIGSVIARGFLRTSYPVYPVTRDMDMQVIAPMIDEPEAVVITVGESELTDVLQKIPETWKTKLILIQNELLPKDWQQHNINPTVISVWFEKKKGQDVKVVVPSPVFGEYALILSQALAALDIPTEIISDMEKMTFELVRKNYYILCSNITGLKVGGTVGELWKHHQAFAKSVLKDVHALQQCLTKSDLDHQALTEAMLVAFDADQDHGCMGRSAPSRLLRALDIADIANLPVPTLKDIQNNLG